MSGQNVGEYYALPIIPSIKGIGPEIDKKIGRALGQMSKVASDALSSGMKTGVAEAEKLVKASSEKVAKLRDKEADATGKLRVAEEKLKEARASGASGASLARAEEARDKALRSQKSALTDVTRETNTLTRAQRDLARAQQEANRIPTRMERFDGIAQRATEQLNGLTGVAQRAGGRAGSTFVGAFGAILAAGGLTNLAQKAIDGVREVFDTGLDFSRTINNFQGVTESTVAQTRQMREAARALGADTSLAGASASDAAMAMTELAKAGFSVDDSITSARGTLELATAGQLEAAKAAEVQANAINAFKLNAGDAGHVADVLANAAVGSSADITDLAQALQQVSGISHGFGENIEDTTAALAMLANVGVKGSDAGTLLKTTLQSITDQGNPAQGAIKALNLQLYDFDKHQFVGFRELFRQLGEAKKAMSPEDFQAQTNILFGSDAMRSAMLGDVGDFDKQLEIINRAGTAHRMAAAQMQGFPGIAEGVSNGWERIKLSLYGAFDTPGAESIGQKIVEQLDNLGNWIDTHQAEIIDAITAVAAGFTMTGKAVADFVAGSSRVMEIWVGMMTKPLGAVLEKFGQFAMNVGDVLSHIPGMSDLGGQISKAGAEAIGGGLVMQHVSDQFEKAARSAESVSDAMGRATDWIHKAGNEAADNARQMQLYKDSFDQIKKSIELIPGTKDFVLKDNSPEVIKKLEDLGFAVQRLPDGRITVRVQYLDQAGRPIDPSQLGISQRQQSAAQGNEGPIPGRAAGGIDSIGSSAHIGGAVYPNGVVRYREPNTGGEAYIPLAGGQRSIDIWEETGRRLGVWAFDMGGFSPDVLAAEQLAGTGYSQGSRTDCSGMPARVINRALGWPDTGLMSTKNAAQWLAERGFRPGVGGPGTITVGWYDHGPNPNDGHMAMTLSNGMNAEAGGKNGVFTIGSGAAGASDPMFDQHMYLPVQSMYGEGFGGDGSFGGFGGSYSGGGGGGIPAGATAGVNPQTGESGYYLPDAKQVRDANQRVDDADARVRRAEQRVAELKADAKESTKQAANDELAKAKREAADARADAEDAKKGKFHATRGDGSGKSGQNGDFGLGGLGSIFGSFLKETFGLDGSLFPDISNLMPVQMLGAALGAFKGPLQGLIDGKLGIQQPGWQPGMAVPGVAGEGQSGGLPFGMIPNAVDAAGFGGPGMAPPAPPAGEPHAGSGAAPGPVDQSRNVHINVDSGPTSAEIGNVVRREVNNVDRLHTYVPRGA